MSSKTTPVQAVIPIDPPQQNYADVAALMKWIFTAVDQINTALNTIQNRLEAGGL